MEPIPFLTPRFPDPALVALDYAEIFRLGVFTNGGPFEQHLAVELARWIGNGVTVSVTASATASLQLACRFLFRPDRPYVLVASFTAPAGPLAVRWSGYEPLLVDIDPNSWQPDHEAAELVLESHRGEIAGVLLTTTFGTANASIERWESLAHRHELALVIDSAPGFGSTYPWGERLGARGDCEIFSFHATKTFAIGEGGAVVARDPKVTEQIDRLKNFGYDDDRRSLGVGLNAKLAELPSAMGLRQLEMFDQRLAKRRTVLERYGELLESLGCGLQPGFESSASSFLSLTLESAAQRDLLGEALRGAGIGWRMYYNPPVHRQPSFAGVQIAGSLAVTDDLAGRIISLPVDDEFSLDDVARVCDVVKQVIRG